MSTDVHVGQAEFVNFTYNYQPLFEHFGLTSITCFEGMAGRHVAPIVRTLIVEITMMDEEEATGLIKGKGEWGTKTTALNSLYELLIACREWPNDLIKTY